MPHTQPHRVHYTFHQMPHTHTHTLVTNEGSPLQNTHITYPIAGSHENTHCSSPICICLPHTPHISVITGIHSHTHFSLPIIMYPPTRPASSNTPFSGLLLCVSTHPLHMPHTHHIVHTSLHSPLTHHCVPPHTHRSLVVC